MLVPLRYSVPPESTFARRDNVRERGDRLLGEIAIAESCTRHLHGDERGWKL
jgi:hypothetical protein